eukprot:jgi/Chlat1/4318/Chrsp29S04480
MDCDESDIDDEERLFADVVRKNLRDQHHKQPSHEAACPPRSKQQQADLSDPDEGDGLPTSTLTPTPADKGKQQTFWNAHHAVEYTSEAEHVVSAAASEGRVDVRERDPLPWALSMGMASAGGARAAREAQALNADSAAIRRLREHAAEVAALAKDRDRAEARARDLEGELAALRERVARAEEERRDHHAALAALRADGERREAQRRSLEGQLLASTEREREYEGEAARVMMLVEHEHKAHAEKVAEVQGHATRAETRLADALARAARAEDDANALRARLAEAETATQQLERDNRRLAKDNARVRTQAEEVEARLATLAATHAKEASPAVAADHARQLAEACRQASAAKEAAAMAEEGLARAVQRHMALAQAVERHVGVSRDALEAAIDGVTAGNDNDDGNDPLADDELPDELKMALAALQARFSATWRTCGRVRGVSTAIAGARDREIAVKKELASCMERALDAERERDSAVTASAVLQRRACESERATQRAEARAAELHEAAAAAAHAARAEKRTLQAQIDGLARAAASASRLLADITGTDTQHVGSRREDDESRHADTRALATSLLEKARTVVRTWESNTRAVQSAEHQAARVEELRRALAHETSRASRNDHEIEESRARCRRAEEELARLRADAAKERSALLTQHKRDLETSRATARRMLLAARALATSAASLHKRVCLLSSQKAFVKRECARWQARHAALRRCIDSLRPLCGMSDIDDETTRTRDSVTRVHRMRVAAVAVTAVLRMSRECRQQKQLSVRDEELLTIADTASAEALLSKKTPVPRLLVIAAAPNTVAGREEREVVNTAAVVLRAHAADAARTRRALDASHAEASAAHDQLRETARTLQRLREREQKLEEDLAEAVPMVEKERQEADKVRREAEKDRREASALRTDLLERERQLASLREKAAQQLEHHDALRRERAVLAAAVDAARRDAEAAREEAARRARAAQVLEERAARAEDAAKRADAHARREALEKVAAAQAEARALESEAAAWRERASAMSSQRDDLTARSEALEAQLNTSRRHALALRSELQDTLSRECAERDDRQQWARARSELLTVRASAEASLARLIASASPLKQRPTGSHSHGKGAKHNDAASAATASSNLRVMSSRVMTPTQRYHDDSSDASSRSSHSTHRSRRSRASSISKPISSIHTNGAQHQETRMPDSRLEMHESQATSPLLSPVSIASLSTTASTPTFEDIKTELARMQGVNC